MRSLNLIVPIVILTSLAFGAESNWPRFRGPNGTGVASPGGSVPVRWTDSGVLWKTRISGTGNSSPIVWGDRVFVQSAPADGSERILVCLDLSSGRVLWTSSRPGSSVHRHQRNTLASSTPATDGERVYAIFWTGTELWLEACDFGGKRIWERNLGAFAGEHGAGASPVVYRGTVIVNNAQDGVSNVVAVRASTGEVLWQVRHPALVACYSTPFLLERPGVPTELIVGSTAGFSGYDPETGNEWWHWKWQFSGDPLRTVASPVFGPEHLFLTSGDGGGARHMVAVRLEGNGATTKASLAWESRRTFPYVPSMLVWEQYLYWVSDLGIAGCNDVKTGKNVWTERLGGNFTASPVLAGGNIYAVNEDGDISVFRADPHFELLGRNGIGELVRATPAVAGNRLLVRGSDHLFCIGEPGTGAHQSAPTGPGSGPQHRTGNWRRTAQTAGSVQSNCRSWIQ
jgi:outer membrane protein assembly factor BamB